MTTLYVRMWHAELTDAGVVARIEDFADGDAWRARLDAADTAGCPVRWWAVVCVDDKVSPNPNRGHGVRHGRGCGPEAPCDRCQTTAREWWSEWAARRAKAAAEAEAKQATFYAGPLGLPFRERP